MTMETHLHGWLTGGSKPTIADTVPPKQTHWVLCHRGFCPQGCYRNWPVTTIVSIHWELCVRHCACFICINIFNHNDTPMKEVLKLRPSQRPRGTQWFSRVTLLVSSRIRMQTCTPGGLLCFKHCSITLSGGEAGPSSEVWQVLQGCGLCWWEDT